MKYRPSSIGVLLGACAVVAMFTAYPALVRAQSEYNVPDVTPGVSGIGKALLTITAGPSGAPAGFEVRWMLRVDFEANGSVWPDDSDPRVNHCAYVGYPTLNTEGGLITRFSLSPGQAVDVEIGDLFDETGISANNLNELDFGENYVLNVQANGSLDAAASAPSADKSCGTRPPTTNCTLTQGFWKNHVSAWPVTSLTLGTVLYNQGQLLSILNTRAHGNGLISLAHQLIAAKLSILHGANPAGIIATINAADALIGSRVIPNVGTGSLAPSLTSVLTEHLDDWVNGEQGPDECTNTVTPTKVRTWGELKELYH